MAYLLYAKSVGYKNEQMCFLTSMISQGFKSKIDKPTSITQNEF